MKIGSLFSGYGGLDLAVGGDLAWYSETEPAACTVMEAHHPGVPNLGDITKVDWSQVEPVDVITGGYPCQPFSNAGMRKGTKDERHLWPYVRDALRAIRPRYAVLENVRGHLTLGFDVVLSDLADLGWSARWGVVRAADAGAPHNRARLFIVAYPQREGLQGQPWTWMEWPSESAASSDDVADTTQSDVRGKYGEPERHGGSEWLQGPFRGSDCIPTNTQGAERRAAQPDDLQARGAAELGERAGASWGEYGPAIDGWQSVIGRTAPAPTIQRRERDRLNPAFVEWMMGLPEGWVTGHGLSASQELKMLGNGVVPQQARLALELLGGVA